MRVRKNLTRDDTFIKILSYFPMEARSGLSSFEAAQILSKNGPNEILSRRHSTLLSSLLIVFKEPMVLILVACSIVYFVLGEASDAFILLVSVVIVAVISFFQEYKAEQSLAALRRLSSPRAFVRRDGQSIRIPGRDVVIGDLLILREGDRIAADSVLIEGFNLLIDESLLTGESVAVSKTPLPSTVSAPSSENEIYSGTLIVRGNGLARVSGTGLSTRLGEISKSLSEIDENLSPLQRQAGKLAKQLGIVALVVCIMTIALYGAIKGQWMSALLAGLTLAVSLMPEELPLIMTIFFAMGAWRMSKHHMLTRHFSAIESLGSIQVLCTDKTGTLTLNKMEVVRSWTLGGSELEKNLFETFLEASEDEPVDPMETAVLNKFGLGQRGTLIQAFPLRSDLMAISNVRRIQNQLKISSKGAVEAILSMCSLETDQRTQIETMANNWARSGIRVLGVAESTNLNSAPLDPRETTMTFLGLVGFADPPRPEVPEAILQCKSAGIQLAMITGDYPATAQAIAHQVGLSKDANARVLSGIDIEKLSDLELRQEVLTTQIFARISPDQKLRIVRAYQSHGLNVGMTGDGVNDAPSLKAADVGIAMGARGTDVAREASDLVLLDDNFSTIVQSIQQGRTIFSNIKRATEFVISIHVPIALIALAQALFQIPMLLFPLQVVLLELIIDPACTLVFEAEESNPETMKNPPRKTGSPLITLKQIYLCVLNGFCMFMAVMVILIISHKLGYSDAQERTLAFTTIVAGAIGLILGKLSTHKYFWQLPRNPWLGALLFFPLIAMLITMFVPGIREILNFEKTPLLFVAIALISGTIAGFIPALAMNRRIYGSGKT